MPVESSNFSFLQEQSPQLARLGALAERYFFDAPADTIFKLRQFAEFIAKDIAAQNALLPASGANFDDVLRALKLRSTVPPQVLEYFHHLRRVGNAATHEAIGTQRDALHALKLSWALGEWYHKSYQGRPNFRAGPFVPPLPPVDASDALRAELDQLRDVVKASSDAEAKARMAAQQADEERARLVAHAATEAEQRAFWEQYAAERPRREPKPSSQNSSQCWLRSLLRWPIKSRSTRSPRGF
jgi:type I restriction enzyme R subunit